MRINELNTMAQRLDAIGRQHLGADGQGRIAPATSSLGGRIVNWIRSRHSADSAQANREVMTRIIDTIRQTEGLGDRFAEVARCELGAKLEAGRPLSGREAARALRDVIRIKTAEDAAQLETRLLNAEGLYGHLSANPEGGGPSILEGRLAAKRALFGLGAATPQQLGTFQDAARQDLLAAARRADHSLTPEEGTAVLDETFRRLSLAEAKEGIAAMAGRVTGDGPGGFTERLTAAMRERGLTGDISASTQRMLEEKIHEKLDNRCLLNRDNMHQPTLEEAGAAADAVIRELVGALDAVRQSGLPEASQRVVQDVILHASMPVTAGMAQAVCTAVGDTGLFLAELVRRDATPGSMRAAFDAYAATLNSAITLPGGDLRPGIGGGPEAGETRRLTAQAACLMAGYGSLNPLSREEFQACDALRQAGQPIPAELAARRTATEAGRRAINNAVGGGSPLHAMHYAMARQPDPGVRTREELLLMNVLEALNEASGGQHDRYLRPSGLGQMSMAQARSFVPEGTGLAEPEGQAFDFAQAREAMTAELNGTVASTPPGSGASVVPRASAAFAQKLNAFSEQFLKDFYRNGVTVNGHTIGQGVGTDNALRSEAALDELIAQFPSPEEAGRVCSPLHQSFGADIQKMLLQNPLTSQRFMAYMTMPTFRLSDRLSIAIDRHDDGSYAVHVDYGSQKVSQDVPDGSEGYNVRIDYSLPGGDEPIHFTATNFDILFNVNRPE